MAEDLHNITALLHKAALYSERNKAAKEEARLRGEAFNVFRVCGVNHYENTHSAILAEWLNPNGSHGQGDVFLSSFLERVSGDFANEFNSCKASVATEFSTKEGRLDILIHDDEGRAVIIENKIYAADQSAQLKRYDKYARKVYGSQGYRLLYLTLDGSEASEQSGKGVDYTPISYSNTIITWLDDCIRCVCDKPFLRETMIQYKNLIKQLTGQDMDKTIEKELVAEMLRSPESVAAIYKAFPAWEKAILEKSLFGPLKEFANSRGLRFSIDERFWSKNTWGYFSFEVQPNLSLVFQYEKQGRNSFYYGIVDKRTDSREIKPLPGLEGGNENWRYGWHYFDVHRNWTIEDIVEMSHDDGAFLRYVCSAVDHMLTEMKSNNIL